jgi:hypothetical protein
MQYGFAYFYYVINVAKTRDLDWDELWSKEIDVDHDGYRPTHERGGSWPGSTCLSLLVDRYLNTNEFLTLAAMAHGKEPDDDFLNELRLCLHAHNHSSDKLTIQHMLKCETAVTGLRKYVAPLRRLLRRRPFYRWSVRHFKRKTEYEVIKQLRDQVIVWARERAAASASASTHWRLAGGLRDDRRRLQQNERPVEQYSRAKDQIRVRERRHETTDTGACADAARFLLVLLPVPIAVRASKPLGKQVTLLVALHSRPLIRCRLGTCIWISTKRRARGISSCRFHATRAPHGL